MELKSSVRRVKSLTGFAAATVMAIGMTAGCSKENDSVPLVQARDTRPVSATVAAANVTLNGWVIAPNYQDLFREELVRFLDPTMLPEGLGFVSSDARSGTGVFIGGKVELESGVLNSNSTARINIRTSSVLLMGIYDEYVGGRDGEGHEIGPIAAGFSRAQGYVQGNTAVLHFFEEITRNDGGTAVLREVVLDGSFDSNTFRGRFSYSNKLRRDGSSSGYAGDLGDFEVPTCQFFRCN